MHFQPPVLKAVTPVWRNWQTRSVQTGDDESSSLSTGTDSTNRRGGWASSGTHALRLLRS